MFLDIIKLMNLLFNIFHYSLTIIHITTVPILVHTIPHQFGHCGESLLIDKAHA